MKLTDILPIEKWVELEKEISERYGFNAAVFDKEGNKITQYLKWANSLCPVIKGDEKGRTFVCAVANQNMIAQAKRTKKTVNGECDAGLVKFLVPIFVGEELLGVIGGCGRLLHGSEVDAFLLNKSTGIDLAKIEALSGDVTDISTDEVNSIISYLEEKIEGIVSGFSK
ncbi:MAG: PocR ligand-binding domain-containing protein [Deltaproteobacteria bacterium]|nr:PocR ligand-binding domain-containing protein [Deltaproteobacteria bacterium]